MVERFGLRMVERFGLRMDELRCLYSTRPIVIECEKMPKITIDSSVLDSVTGGAPTFNSTADLS